MLASFKRNNSMRTVYRYSFARIPYQCIVIGLIFLHATVIFLLRFSYVEETELMKEEGYHYETLEVSRGVQLILKLHNTAGNAYSAGPHEALLQIADTTCQYPGFWIRLVGHCLVNIELKQESDRMWKGNFAIPMSGPYKVDARWYGCERDRTEWRPLSQSIDMLVHVEQSSPNESGEPNSLFLNKAWVSTLSSTLSDKGLPDYVWKLPKQEDLSAYTMLEAANSVVLVDDSNTNPNGFYKFHELGNYELLCFMGSDSAFKLWETFLQLRPQISAGQRPFKFHYYNVSNFVHPDVDWELETKQRLRKCKHILLSLEEPLRPLSQAEFKSQLTTFVGHLLKVMDDSTFPIRLLTFNEPPMNTNNCYPPFVLPRSTDHPCNDVIKDLFRTRAFPERVHLFDNTDLSNPQFDQNANDILAAVALRVFIVVGKQVSDWRAVGQKGMIDGLHRNGIVEPNFDLIPYEGWV
ncbi:hypothetical protein FisN_12Hh149 [Fistulifera solaris]|uniref:Uncharacterized protein n=1 Tax=Fistulifera solaris TaxID=1519565 RepID=A0A1Z5KBC0_FISSO|nr:hypothetical protein FisN_12Hh149 [Fistulifera solaris]|eukprot:GAX23583.1 hypothetical protein FisN_12Hh149 [Fistulifera solaris]